MGSVRAISSIFAAVTLGALFGRRGGGAGRGEVPEPLPDASPSPSGPDQPAPVGLSDLQTPEGGQLGALLAEDVVEATSGDSGGNLRPVPHPIRPWELWHPATEPAHLFGHAREERVTWQEMVVEDDSQDGNRDASEPEAIDLSFAPIDDVWSALDPAVGAPDPDGPGDGIGDATGEHFGFGRLRPFTRSVVDDSHGALGRSEVGQDPAPDRQGPQGDVGEELDLGDGDVLFRDLVSPERMTASEHALEDQDQDQKSSTSSLINGPVSRRIDRDHARGRRRLPTALRAFGDRNDRSGGS